jgi:6-phosphogluconolactonase
MGTVETEPAVDTEIVELTLGAYTNGVTEDRGIFRAWVAADGSEIGLRGVTPVSPTVNPTWVVFSADGRFVYAACEGAEGAVAALKVDDGEGGGLSLLGIQPTGGVEPCHVALVNGGTHLVSANYASGSIAVHPVLADGSLGGRTDAVQHVGSGPYAERQAGPHAHMIAEDPSGRHILALDLGTDTVFAYVLDAETGTLTEASRTILRGGFGPRHLAFHPNGELVYVIGELGFEIAVCEYDAETGRLSPVSIVPVVEGGGVLGVDFPSGVRVTPDGRFLYAAVRGPDLLRTYSLGDPRNPEFVSAVPTGGSWPRDIVLSPDGTLLFSANQMADVVTVFRLDPVTGVPSPTGATLGIPAPACVLMR